MNSSKNFFFYYFFVVCIFLVEVFLTKVNSGNVLFIYPLASKSETNLFLPLAKALSEKGHAVTIITPVNTTSLSKNIKQIIPTNPIIDSDVEASIANPLEMRRLAKNQIEFFLSYDSSWIFQKCHQVYQNEEFNELFIKGQPKYDLIIMSGMFQNCFNGILSKLKSPYIFFSSCPAPNWLVSATGLQQPPSFVPIFDYSQEMTFPERVGNTFMTWFFQSYFLKQIRKESDLITKKYLGNNLQSSEEIEHNVSMVFSHGHPSLTFPRPALPDLIEVGGIHCHPPRPLPNKLEKFVNEAKDGVILFSLGSVIQAHTLPNETRKVFLNVFSRLKQRVLWKWETETMKDLPSNVMLSRWLPQQDILGHPATKLFISHGGLLSTMESAYHGVPMIGLPIFVDQTINMKNVEIRYSITLEILDLTEKDLEKAIHQILNEPKYTNRAKQMSREFRDQLNSPMDRAVFWSEYVMRHQGAPSLRSASRKLNFFQYHSLDVVIFFGTFLLMLLIAILILVRKLVNYLFGQVSNHKSKAKKKIY